MTERLVDFQSVSLKPPPSGGGAFTKYKTPIIIRGRLSYQDFAS